MSSHVTRQTIEFECGNLFRLTNVRYDAGIVEVYCVCYYLVLLTVLLVVC